MRLALAVRPILVMYVAQMPIDETLVCSVGEAAFDLLLLERQGDRAEALGPEVGGSSNTVRPILASV